MRNTVSKASPSQQQIKALFNHGTNLYISGLGVLFGVNEGIILSQLLYWRGKGHRRDNSFYKTHDELYKETGLTRDKQDRAIKKLKAYGFLETKNKGVPQKRHFYIDVEALILVIIELLESSAFRDLDIAARSAGNHHSITEITQEINTKTNTEITLEPAIHIGRTQSIGEILGYQFRDKKLQ